MFRDIAVEFVCDVCTIHNRNEMSAPTIFVNADKSKISQVMRNLLSNALKFSPSESTIVVRVSLRQQMVADPTDPGFDAAKDAQTEFSLFRVEVEDRGVGMQANEVARLFREVVQFDASRLQAGGGSGIGLYLSKGIMDLHSGNIGVGVDINTIWFLQSGPIPCFIRYGAFMVWGQPSSSKSL